MGFTGSQKDIETLNNVFTNLPSGNVKSYRRYAVDAVKATHVATPDVKYAFLEDLITLSGYVVKTEGIVHNGINDRILYVKTNHKSDSVFNRLGCKCLGTERCGIDITKKYLESHVIGVMRDISKAGKLRVGQIMVQAQKIANVISNKAEFESLIQDLTKMAKCMGRAPLDQSKNFSIVLKHLKDRCPDPSLRLILARAEDAYRCLEPEIVRGEYVGASEYQIYHLLGIHTEYADVGKSVKGVIIKKDEFNKQLRKLGLKSLRLIEDMSSKYGINNTKSIDGNQ